MNPSQRNAIRLRLLPRLKAGTLKNENRLLQQLFDAFPDLKFWGQIKLPSEIRSFMELFEPSNQAFLKKAWRGFVFEPPRASTPVKLLPTKLGHDYPIKKTPQTMREFLNG